MLLVVLFRAILLAILIYFAIKAVRNLLRAIREDRPASGHLDPGPNGRSRPRDVYVHYRQEPSVRQRRRDVEEARWEDIE